MSVPDIRWGQRFNHFCKALGQLTKFVDKGELSELEVQGLIKSFEYTYELAWNTMKDYFEEQGETDIHGSRDAIRLAFRRGLIEAGETWMEMIKSRTLTSHTYQEKIAKDISDKIITDYFREFQSLRAKMASLMSDKS